MQKTVRVSTSKPSRVITTEVLRSLKNFKSKCEPFCGCSVWDSICSWILATRFNPSKMFWFTMLMCFLCSSRWVLLDCLNAWIASVIPLKSGAAPHRSALWACTLWICLFVWEHLQAVANSWLWVICLLSHSKFHTWFAPPPLAFQHWHSLCPSHK